MTLFATSWNPAMYSILLDTNVILDYLSRDRPAHAATVEALLTCMSRPDVRVFVPACILKDVYFVYARHYGSEEHARRLVALLRRAFEIAPLTTEILDTALASDEPDLEDGIVRAMAEGLGVDAIFSRDSKAYATSVIRRLDAGGVIRFFEVAGGVA